MLGLSAMIFEIIIQQIIFEIIIQQIKFHSMFVYLYFTIFHTGKKSVHNILTSIFQGRIQNVVAAGWTGIAS